MTQLPSREIRLQLGFSQDAADEIFIGQRIDYINEWLNLYNGNVNALLRNVQNPCGGGQGKMISFKAEMNLHLAVFFVCQKNLTS